MSRFISAFASRAADRGPSLRIAALVLLVLPSAGMALDTIVDYRDTHQTARVGTQTFNSFARRGVISVRQTARLSQPWMLEGSFRVVRDLSGSDVDGVGLTQIRYSYQPTLTASYQSTALNGGVRGTWLRQEYEGDSPTTPRSELQRYLGWLNADVTRSTRLSSNLSLGTIRAIRPFSADLEQRAISGWLLANQDLGEFFGLAYRLSGVDTDLISSTVYRTQWTHDLSFTGNPRLLNDRMDIYFRARTRYLTQRIEAGESGVANVFRAPFSGGVILDPTPEAHDPLEPDQGTFVPEMYDGDLEAATEINIGDSAPAVVEYGGDYRNLRYDFGDTQAFASAVVYVDERLLSPELFGWRAFVTDDPEARVWQEVPPSQMTVRYGEWGVELQGWEFVFGPDVVGRFLKVVNVKFGTTIPDLHVTEMEVFLKEASAAVVTDRTAQRHEFDGRVNYDVTSRLMVGYQTRLDRRGFQTGPRSIDRMRHALLGRYNLGGPYDLHGRVENNTFFAENRNSTNITTYQVSASRSRSRRLSGSLAWYRTEDRSRGRDFVSDALSLQTHWKAAPRLQLRQTLSAGKQHDDVFATDNRSFVMVNSARGAPFRQLFLDINWAERWVSQNAGVGYDRYTDLRFDVVYTPAPLVSLASRTRWQRRLEDYWNSRQTITWNPWPGGTVDTFLAVDAYYLSRFETWEYGARANVKWRIKPGLYVEGTLQLQKLYLNGLESHPVTTFLHVSWLV